MKSKFSIFLAIVGAVIVLVVTVTMLSSSLEQRAVAQTVPELSGLDINAATDELSGGSFGYKLLYTESTEPRGTVIKQVPAAGEELNDGEVIRLYIAIPPKEGSSDPAPKTQSPQAPATQQQPQNSNSNNQQQPQQNSQNSQKTKAQKDAERQAAIDRINAEYEAELQKIQQEQARLAEEIAEMDRVRALRNALDAATNERIAAGQAVQQAQASVNDFAARGMIQSGAGSLAIANLNAAQIRYDNAIIAEQAANAAYAAR